jgi:DNA-binding NarL/FixJ family response regulator
MADSAYRVLVIDDHRIFRCGLRGLLEARPEIAAVADSDGALALAQVSAFQPTVVLLHIHGSKLDEGVRLLEQLRNPVSPVRTITLLDQDAETNVVQAVLQAGAVGCIFQDSADFEQVIEAIRQVASGLAFLPSATLARLVALGNSGSAATRHESQRPLNELTNREVEVLELIAQGQTNRQIADQLIVSESTVRTHLHNILDKLAVVNRVQAATIALQAGLGPDRRVAKPVAAIAAPASLSAASERNRPPAVVENAPGNARKIALLPRESRWPVDAGRASRRSCA